jgi:hypothetical protein
LNDNEFLGGCDATLDYIRDEFMSGPKAVVGAAPQMKDDGVEMGKYDYDLVCIGGGSGGLAMTKEAVRSIPTCTSKKQTPTLQHTHTHTHISTHRHSRSHKQIR